MNELKKINPEIYKNIGLDQLVVYSVYRVLEMNEECTFERLVFECYTSFPEVFGFIRYPEWPDSSRITKSWLRCRTDKGWLSGTTKEGFKLTRIGKSVARETESILCTNKAIKKNKINKKYRERYEAVLNHIISSIVYKNFEKKEEISSSDFISFLGGTLETPKRILRQNLNLYYDAVKIYKKNELLPFLNFCKKYLINLKD